MYKCKNKTEAKFSNILKLKKDNSFYNWCIRDINYKYPHEVINTLFDPIDGGVKVKTMVIDENSWIFENTNLKNNEEFGLEIIPTEGDKSYDNKYIVAKSHNDSYHFIVKNNNDKHIIRLVRWTHNILISKTCNKYKNIFNKIN